MIDKTLYNIPYCRHLHHHQRHHHHHHRPEASSIPAGRGTLKASIWVVVKIMVPLWVPIMIRRLLFRVPKKGP